MAGKPLSPVLTAQEMAEFFAKAFPDRGNGPEITEISSGFARMKHKAEKAMQRPGGIISGPTQMGFADHAAYVVILAHIGIVPMAVTSNLNMSFLRGIAARDFYADAQLIKLGRRLATVDVRIWQDDPANICAQSTVTYALPADE